MQPAVFSVFSVSDMTLLKTNKSNDSRKKRRNHVKQACLPCRRAHTACDETKPCSRCVKQQRPELCVQTQEEYNELIHEDESGRVSKRIKREGSPDTELAVSGQTTNPVTSGGPPPVPTNTSLSLPSLPSLPSPSPVPPPSAPTPPPSQFTPISPGSYPSNQSQPLITPQRPIPHLPLGFPLSKNTGVPTRTSSPLPSSIETPNFNQNIENSGSNQSQSTHPGSWMRESTTIPKGDSYDIGLPANVPTGSLSYSTSNYQSENIMSDTNCYNLIMNTFNLVVNTNNKMETFLNELNRVRTELATAKQQQEQMMDFFRVIQKQMLYMLHNPIHPVQPGEPAISVWDIHSFKLIDCNPEFEQLLKYDADYLKANFYLKDLIPDFFRPFAFDFYNEMMYNMGPDKDPKVAQMMYFRNADGEEFPVHMSCQPHYDQYQKPQQFVMISRQVAKYTT